MTSLTEQIRNGPGRDRATGQAGHQTWPPDRQAAGPCRRAGGGPLYSLRSLSKAGLTEALTRAGRLSQTQKDFVLDGSLARGPGIRADDHRVRRRMAAAAPGLGPWATASLCKVPASRLPSPQAAGLARVTIHQERLLTRKYSILNYTYLMYPILNIIDMYNWISIFINMHVLCYMDIHHAIMTLQIFMYTYLHKYRTIYICT